MKGMIIVRQAPSNGQTLLSTEATNSLLTIISIMWVIRGFMDRLTSQIILQHGTQATTTVLKVTQEKGPCTMVIIDSDHNSKVKRWRLCWSGLRVLI